MDANHQIIAAQAPPIVADYSTTFLKGIGFLPIDPLAAPHVQLETLLKSWRRMTGLIVGSAAFDFTIFQHRVAVTHGGALQHSNVYPSGIDGVTGSHIVVFDRSIYGKYAKFYVASAGPDLFIHAFIRLMPIAQ